MNIGRSLLATVLFAALPLGSAQAYCLNKVQGSNPYATWQVSPVTYHVSQNLSDPQLLAAIDAAFAAWDAVPCSTLKLTKGTQFTPCFQKPCAANTVEFLQSTGAINVFWYQSSTGYPTNSQYVAYMYYWHDGQGKLVGASIAINAFSYKWNATGGSAAQLILDLQNEMTAFIGAVIGLADSNVPGASMYPGISFGDTSKRSLAQDDIDGLVYLYKVSSCPAPPAPGASGCSAPPPTPDAGPPDATPASDGPAPASDGLTPPDGPASVSDTGGDASITTPDLQVLTDAIAESAAPDGVADEGSAPADAGPGREAAPDSAPLVQGDAVAGDGGPGDAAADLGPFMPPTDEGCACRVGHTAKGDVALVPVLLLLVLLRRRA